MGQFLSKEEVSSYSPSDGDWGLYEKARNAFESFDVPRLFDRNDPHSRLFVVLADGTENDLKDLSKYTNVGVLDRELKKNPNSNIAYSYKSGVGTYQGTGSFLDKTAGKLDAAFSFTDRQRSEELYESLSKQVNTWKQDDPEARISVAQVGFSRGCGVAVLLNEMIHERGIKDTETKKIINGKLQPTGEHLVKPGQIRQAALLYDPVTTFMQGDFSLSPSTVSALQLNATHEYRSLFPVTSIAAGPGQLQVDLPGCHTDIGGGYKKDGLARYARDMGNTFLNQLAGHTLFTKQDLPPRDDASCVIHHSWEHKAIYRKLAERRIVQGVVRVSSGTLPPTPLPDADSLVSPHVENLPKEGPFRQKALDFTSLPKKALLEKYPEDRSILDALAVYETARLFAGQHLEGAEDRQRFLETVNSSVAHNLEHGYPNHSPRVLEQQEHFSQEEEL
jgi:hypothetical protein